MADPNPAPATQTAAPAAQAQPAAAQAVAAPAQSAQPSAAQVIPPALAAMLPPAAPAATGTVAQPATPAAQAPAQPATPAAEPSKKSADEQVSELRQQLTARTVREHVVSVAAEAGAINPEQVHKLLADELDALPDGRVIVKGDPRADARQHVAKFLAGNMHMLKPTVPGGGAGTPAAVGAPAAAATIDPKTLEGGTANVRNFVGRLFTTTPAPATGGAAGAR